MTFRSDNTQLSSNCDPEGMFALIVTDVVASNRLRLLELRIEADALGCAVMGLGNQACTAIWRVGSLRTGMKEIKAPARVTISHPGAAMLVVQDEPSGIDTLTLVIRVNHLTLALGGRASQPCSATWAVDLVGKRRESKVEFVPKDESEAVFRVLETDGWVAGRDDWQNHHRAAFKTLGRQKVMGYNVTFERWI